MEISLTTSLSTTHYFSAQKRGSRNEYKHKKGAQTLVLVFACFYKKTEEKGQGSAVMACLKSVREEYVRDLGTLVMLDTLQI